MGISKQLLGSGADVAKCTVKKKAKAAVQSAWTGFKSLFGQRRRLGPMDMLKGAAGAVKGKALEAARKVATPLCQKAYAIAERAASKVLGDKFDNDGKSCLKEIVDAKCVEKVNALIK